MINKSTGNMYEWITHTWNTVKGECPHGCSYCYMHRWGKQKPVRFDERELKTDLGSGNFIFVGSSCDMFAMAIPAEWIRKTLDHCKRFDNTYLFQTKNPELFYECWQIGDIPANSILCTTIETDRWNEYVMQNSPKPYDRAYWMGEASEVIKTYVTIEPIMDFDLDYLVELIDMCKPIQVNIGADSGNNHLPEPPKEKILQLISELEKFTVVKQKVNLKRLLKTIKP